MNSEKRRIGFIGGLFLTGMIGLSAAGASSASAMETHRPFKTPFPTPAGSNAPEHWIPVPCPSNLPWNGASETRKPEGFKPKIEFVSIKLPQPTQGTEVYCDWWQKVPELPGE